jgi:hypothetical protein
MLIDFLMAERANCGQEPPQRVKPEGFRGLAPAFHGQVDLWCAFASDRVLEAAGQHQGGISSLDIVELMGVSGSHFAGDGSR